MDLNPLFTSPTAFRPAGDTGALDLFARTGIALVHGWLVDPASPEHAAMTRLEDYDNAVTLIAEADHLMRGQLVRDEDAEFGAHGEAGPSAAGPSAAGPSSQGFYLNDVDRRKVEDGACCPHPDPAIPASTFAQRARTAPQRWPRAPSSTPRSRS